MRFCFFFWFFKNCELIRDSSLWHSKFIPSLRDLVIIIGSKSVTYTFGPCFIYKCWVRISNKKNLNFSFLRQVFQYYLLCLIEVCIIQHQSQVLKSGLLSLYFLFPLIILSCSFCVHYSLFLFFEGHQVIIVHQAPKKKKKGEKKKVLRNKRNRKILFVVSVLSNQNIVFFCPLPLIHCFNNIFLKSVLF